MVRKGIVLSLIIILGYCVYLYIESTAFYDLRPYFYKNIEIYEKMVDARVNTPNDEKQLSVLEKKLRTKAKVEYVFSRLVQNEVSGEYERIEDIDFTRANQSIVYSTRPEDEVSQDEWHCEKLADNWYYIFRYSHKRPFPPTYPEEKS